MCECCNKNKSTWSFRSFLCCKRKPNSNQAISPHCGIHVNEADKINKAKTIFNFDHDIQGPKVDVILENKSTSDTCKCSDNKKVQNTDTLPLRDRQKFNSLYEESFKSSKVPGKTAPQNLDTILEGQQPNPNKSNFQLGAEGNGHPRSPLAKPFIDPKCFRYVYEEGSSEPVFVGGGACGFVYLCQITTPDGVTRQVCVKNSFDTDYRRTFKEYVCYDLLRDTGFVPWAYGIIDHMTDGEQQYGLVLEFLGYHSDLLSFLRNPDTCYVARAWVELGIEMGMSLQRIHDEGIIMNDITVNNIMVQELEDKQLKTYIIDFSHATVPQEIVSIAGGAYTTSGETSTTHLEQMREKDIRSFGSILFQISQQAKTSEDKALLNSMEKIAKRVTWPYLASSRPEFSLDDIVMSLHTIIRDGD